MRIAGPLLAVLLIFLAGCASRERDPGAQAYEVEFQPDARHFAYSLLSNAAPGEQAGSSWLSLNGSMNCGSGKDALVGVAIVVAVLVVAVSVDAVVNNISGASYQVTGDADGLAFSFTVRQGRSTVFLDERIAERLREAGRRCSISAYGNRRGCHAYDIRLRDGRIFIDGG